MSGKVHSLPCYYCPPIRTGNDLEHLPKRTNRAALGGNALLPYVTKAEAEYLGSLHYPEALQHRYSGAHPSFDENKCQSVVLLWGDRE